MSNPAKNAHTSASALCNHGGSATTKKTQKRSGILYNLWITVGTKLGYHREIPVQQPVSYEQLTQNVVLWAKERGIIAGITPYSQYTKVVEELGEVARAIFKSDVPGQIDGIGDVQVTLILLAEKLGLDYAECLEAAYAEIKNRKGKITNNTFVKEAA